MKTFYLFFATTLFLAAASALRGEITASTSFEPPVIREGESSVFRLTIRGEGSGSMGFHNAGPPRIPPVDGLRLRYLGPNQEMRIINGEASVRLTHLYRAEPSGPGDYEIPAFAVRLGDTDIDVPAARLQVLGRGEAPEPGSRLPDRRPAWMEIELPRESLYVGEAVPTGVRLFLDSRQVTDASLGAEHPEKIGDAFSIGDFGPMRQDQIALDGLPVTVADWDVLLTPLKTGPQPLVFELPLAVALRDSPGRRPDPFGSFFGGSPFRSFFNREEIRAYSDDREVEILPLPEENRPESFTGGIGEFQFDKARVSSENVQVGEPFLYEIRIEGRGNFDRMEPPIRKDGDEDWREYSPEISFTPGDGLGYTGTKQFTFTLVPRSEGITETPAFAFSYFSPEEGEYRTVEIPPRPLRVSPAPAGSRPTAPRQEDRNPVEARRGPDLLPLETRWPGNSHHSLRPLVTRPWFLVLQILIGGCLSGMFLLLRHWQKLRDDADYARRSRARRAGRRCLAEASSHASAGRAGDFYLAACRAIQEIVGPHQGGEPESLTENEVIAVLRKNGRSDRLLADTRHFFQTAEAIRYGARPPAASDLPDELAQLRNLLRSLRNRKARDSGPSATPPLLGILLLSSFFAAPAELPAQTPADPASADRTVVDEAAETDPEPGVISDPSKARAVFTEAVAAYQEGKFAAAVSGFRSLLPRFGSATVHYNLANAFYRLRSYPEAILHYEKAFALDPSNPDIRANLTLTREAADLEPPPPSPFATIGHRLSWSEWTWLLALGAWGLLAVLAVVRTTNLPALWRNSLILLFSLVLILSMIGQSTWIAGRNGAVVLNDDAALRIAPTASSPLETRLPAGIMVRIGERYGDFQEVRVSEAATGWLLHSSLGRIWNEKNQEKATDTNRFPDR